jgi:hypothetical protein
MPDRKNPHPYRVWCICCNWRRIATEDTRAEIAARHERKSHKGRMTVVTAAITDLDHPTMKGRMR